MHENVCSDGGPSASLSVTLSTLTFFSPLFVCETHSTFKELQGKKIKREKKERKNRGLQVDDETENGEQEDQKRPYEPATKERRNAFGLVIWSNGSL